jgi:hypothetical protein
MRKMRIITALALASAVTVLSYALLGCGSAARTEPKGAIHITGPIKGGEHGWPFGAYFGNISTIGYVEEEFFIEGNAAHYTLVGEWTNDGKWTLEKGYTSPYKTRILVWRPADPATFNGTIVVEWSNVTVGSDYAFIDFQGMPDLTSLGFAYALVTAQPIGVHGFKVRGQGLVSWDPERYSTLSIPDDGVPYDIFTQAGIALGPDRKTRTTGADPMNGFEVKKLIAVGGSQSGIRLLSYVNGVQPMENVYHAIIPGWGSGQAHDFTEAIAEDMTAPDPNPAARRLRPVWVREDLSIPVMVFNSEAEADWTSYARQPETDKFRHWEVAGARHGPSTAMYMVNLKYRRDGITSIIPEVIPSPFREADWQPVFAAAIWHINNWIDGGSPPPIIPPIVVTERNGRPEYGRDQYGNALGGIRLPEIEVPYGYHIINTRTRALRGAESIPFSTAYLKQLYPTREDYVAKVTEAANKAKAAGVLLQHAVDDYIKRAEAAPIPEPAYSDAIKALLRF